MSTLAGLYERWSRDPEYREAYEQRGPEYVSVVRLRLDGICGAAGVPLRNLDLQVITAPSVRLDLAADRHRLEHTVATLKPRLLILDPFVRLHCGDENSSAEIAPLLAFLRHISSPARRPPP
ncbi:MAG: AAA family ATPase [Gammaproteobacteria bacterium]|nr:AAA family ATPase [Gammaproteobacteria bacterium]MDE0362737.1 AAA family ATPase [Rhodospirillaceae bacterium]